jgi:hypothetical protein
MVHVVGVVAISGLGRSNMTPDTSVMRRRGGGGGWGAQIKKLVVKGASIF